MGRERALGLEPSTDLPWIQAALAETRQGRTALGAVGRPPWEVIPDVRDTLERARTVGAVVEGTELVELIPLLEAAGRLAGYGRSLVPVAPELGRMLGSLPSVGPLLDQLRRALEPDGSLRDEASPALRRLRARLRELRRDLVKRLESFFQQPGADALFQERYVTVRHGRYVLPVLAGAKGRLRGIVHDRSQSGATLFVEPESVVEDNNQVADLTRDEEVEVLRVLAVLTDAVREALPELTRLVDGIGEADLVFARAELAERMEATEPVCSLERVVDVRDARHPLLLAQGWERRDGTPGRAVVPVDLRLDAEHPLLVITGPNAGGKTVALKTLGLFAMMAQAGLHLPAREGARLPRVSRLFAIIGDEQSVAENLSTFSAFVKALREVLDHVDADSLVLLDELGAGTDPDDGAALAQAVLEELAGRGCLCIASTHLEPLKAFAATDGRARNASVEFDGERLEPTFRLVYDRPGQSYALAIGARLGLPPALIERARGHRSTQQRALQELIARLDARDRQEAERAAVIEKRELDSAALLRRAQAEAEAARETARATVARAQAEAQKLVVDVRRAVNAEWDTLKRGERTRKSLEASRSRLREAGQRVAMPAPDPGTPHPASDNAGLAPLPGDRVTIAHLGLKGDVVEMTGGTATVRAGAVTVKVPARALQVIQRGGGSLSPQPSPWKGEGAGSPSLQRGEGRVRGDIGPELHLIGRTADEAREALEKYLDDAFLAGLPTVRIIHGKGTGTLRRAVHELLAGHPLVEEHRSGALHEGGEGATVAQLRTA
jgi:DNA mismatch repair protein MutS2